MSIFGKILGAGLFGLFVMMWILTSSGYTVNNIDDYKGKVLLYKKSVKEGSRYRGTHYYGRSGFSGK